MKKLILLFALVALFAACKKEETIKPSETYGKLTAYYNLPLDEIYLKVMNQSGQIWYASILEQKQSDLNGFNKMVTISNIEPKEYLWYIFENDTDSSWVCSEGKVLIEVGKTAIIKSEY
jgi:hypothetical protein